MFISSDLGRTGIPFYILHMPSTV